MRFKLCIEIDSQLQRTTTQTTHTHTHTHIHHTHTNRKHTHIDTWALKLSHSHTHQLSVSHIHSHTHMATCTYTHTHGHMHLHTHTHTHTHTYILTQSPLSVKWMLLQGPGPMKTGGDGGVIIIITSKVGGQKRMSGATETCSMKPRRNQWAASGGREPGPLGPTLGLTLREMPLWYRLFVLCDFHLGVKKWFDVYGIQFEENCGWSDWVNMIKSEVRERERGREKNEKKTGHYCRSDNPTESSFKWSAKKREAERERERERERRGTDKDGRWKEKGRKRPTEIICPIAGGRFNGAPSVPESHWVRGNPLTVTPQLVKHAHIKEMIHR